MIVVSGRPACSARELRPTVPPLQAATPSSRFQVCPLFEHNPLLEAKPSTVESENNNSMTIDDLPLVHVSRPPRTSENGQSQAGDDRPPALIVLHGRGADEQDLLPLADHLPDSLHVLSVRAPEPLGMMGYTWYDLDLSAGGLHESQPDPEGFRRSLDALSEFVDAAIDRYDLDPQRVGLLGFSQGSILSLAALTERPERYDWVVALHGYLAESHDDPETLAGAAGTPVFVGCGSQDQVIPAERARQAAQTLADAGLDVTFREYGVGHGTSPREVADVAEWIAERVR